MKAGRFESFGRFVDRCESPIERLFLVGLLFMGDYTFEPFEHDSIIARDSMGVELGMQVTIDSYRIDFTFARSGKPERFAIELDGFVHHGSNPGQFERDSARQRFITSKGWTVLRFSGREVLRDPRRCAAEAMGAASRLVEESAPDSTAPTFARITESRDPVVREIRQRAATATTWDDQLRAASDADNLARSRQGLPPRKVG